MRNNLNLKKISTEKRNDNSKKIDKMSALEISKLINREDETITLAVRKTIKEIAKATEICAEAIKKNGRIIYLGAGTSGRLGILDASEMPPTYGVDSNVFIGLIAGGTKAIQNAVENSEDNGEAAVEDLMKINFSKKDVLIGISASGRTPYVVNGLNYAKKLKSKTISITTSKNSEIAVITDVAIEAITGPEVITGSTRMKSGTAQKMILNMISTGTMILSGYVYENLMINIQCKNEKLKKRGQQIVAEISGEKNLNKIDDLLIETNYDLKKVIVALKLNVSIQQSGKLLKNKKINQLINNK